MFHSLHNYVLYRYNVCVLDFTKPLFSFSKQTHENSIKSTKNNKSIFVTYTYLCMCVCVCVCNFTYDRRKRAKWWKKYAFAAFSSVKSARMTLSWAETGEITMFVAENSQWKWRVGVQPQWNRMIARTFALCVSWQIITVAGSIV